MLEPCATSYAYYNSGWWSEAYTGAPYLVPVDNEGLAWRTLFLNLLISRL